MHSSLLYWWAYTLGHVHTSQCPVLHDSEYIYYVPHTQGLSTLYVNCSYVYIYMHIWYSHWCDFDAIQCRLWLLSTLASTAYVHAHIYVSVDHVWLGPLMGGGVTMS